MLTKRPYSLKWNLILGLVLLAPAIVPAETDSQANGTEGTTAAEVKRGSVARAIFTSQIVDREPVDTLTTIPNTQDKIYFFSDLRDLEGQIITHRWEYNKQVMAEVKFKVGGPRWRVYSSKNLVPDWTGEWTVVVLDESGWPLKASIFEYTQAAGDSMDKQ